MSLRLEGASFRRVLALGISAALNAPDGVAELGSRLRDEGRLTLDDLLGDHVAAAAAVAVLALRFEERDL